MATILFDFDKIDRKSIKIMIKGEEHEVYEPTVRDIAKLSKLDFKSENEKSVLELIKTLAPTIVVGDLTRESLQILVNICEKCWTGEFNRKKLKTEEVMVM